MTERETTLFLTHCSSDKNGPGDPLTLYASYRIRWFGEVCTSAQAPWAIVSAKYALFFPDECHGPYDTQLSFRGGRLWVKEQGRRLSAFESETRVNWLASTTRSRLQEPEVSRVVFYVGTAVQRAVSYLLLVHQALDSCSKKHDRPNDVVECIKNGSRLCIANGKLELEGELRKLEPHAHG